VVKEDEGPTVPGLHVPRWVAVVSSAAGTVLGIAASLYSTEFRTAIGSSSKLLSGRVLSVLLAAVVSSAISVLIYRWIVIRRQHRAQIVRGEIHIESDVLDIVRDEHDSVAGRDLHYLEIRRETSELVVFLHGLGLDANDFRPYMAESKFHCVALTLYGFNVEEKEDDRYKPISLQAHVQLVAYALRKIKRLYPQKQVTLVGFSFGADVILLLPQFAERAARDLRIREAVLLDPNVNETTTTISSRIAVVEKDRPLTELIGILQPASNVSEFRNLCEYVYKITAKNFAQIQRHAQDMIAEWPGDSFDIFLDRLGQLSTVAAGVHAVLSFDYEQNFNGIARGAVSRGLNPANLELSQLRHFELISARFLKERLEGVVPGKQES
jgi:pimeloyl-ACP methyl ester carboxylesterase